LTPQAKTFSERLHQQFKDKADAAAKVYPASTDEEAFQSAGDLASDLFIVYGTWKWIDTQSKTGKPVYNAIVWQDTRTADYVAEYSRMGGQDQFRRKVGLPLATYFSGLKIKWILENVPGVRALAEKGEVIFGNIDTYLIWQLTGGTNGGIHVTDVSNASRTMLMNLETLNWSTEITKIFGVPIAMLPKICSSSEVYGTAKTTALAGVPVAGDLGDQQAALVGQTCFKPGQAKNTYGTGCFLLLNTGTTPVQSEFRLLTTLAYKLGDGPAVYALEGSVAITGALVQWVRDNFNIIKKSSEIEALAKTVDDNGGVYFVPALSGGIDKSCRVRRHRGRVI
jgi:glycerol kinase